MLLALQDRGRSRGCSILISMHHLSALHTSLCTFHRSIHPPPTSSNSTLPSQQFTSVLEATPLAVLSSSSSQAPFSSAAAPRTQLTDFEWPAMSERASKRGGEKVPRKSARTRARSVPARMVLRVSLGLALGGGEVGVCAPACLAPRQCVNIIAHSLSLRSLFSPSLPCPSPKRGTLGLGWSGPQRDAPTALTLLPG